MLFVFIKYIQSLEELQIWVNTKDGTINNVIDVDTRNIYKNQSDIELPLDDTEYTSSDVKIVLKKSTVALK